jgi:hypothetical protein
MVFQVTECESYGSSLPEGHSLRTDALRDAGDRGMRAARTNAARPVVVSPEPARLQAAQNPPPDHGQERRDVLGGDGLPVERLEAHAALAVRREHAVEDQRV